MAAKTALAYLWGNEFVIREQLHGSFGNAAPPIVSRLPQFLLDGHLLCNAARKIANVPLPFPHTQAHRWRRCGCTSYPCF